MHNNCWCTSFAVDAPLCVVDVRYNDHSQVQARLTMVKISSFEGHLLFCVPRFVAYFLNCQWLEAFVIIVSSFAPESGVCSALDAIKMESNTCEITRRVVILCRWEVTIC